MVTTVTTAGSPQGPIVPPDTPNDEVYLHRKLLAQHDEAFMQCGRLARRCIPASSATKSSAVGGAFSWVSSTRQPHAGPPPATLPSPPELAMVLEAEALTPDPPTETVLPPELPPPEPPPPEPPADAPLETVVCAAHSPSAHAPMEQGVPSLLGLGVHNPVSGAQAFLLSHSSGGGHWTVWPTHPTSPHASWVVHAAPSSHAMP